MTLSWWARKAAIEGPYSTNQDLSIESIRLDSLLECVCNQIKSMANFDFVAIQFVRPVENYVETVYGIGVAKNWSERAKHYIETDPKLRDIQADIVQTGLTEIIVGEDPRFDSWIYSEYGHQDYIRIFIPLLILCDESGELNESWFESIECKVESNITTESRKRTALQIGPKIPDPKIEVIGTLEAGYCISSKVISVEDAVSLYKETAKSALSIHKLLLPYGLKSLIKEVKNNTQAEAISLYFLYDQYRDKYVYEIASKQPDFISKIIQDYNKNSGRSVFDKKETAFISISQLIEKNPSLRVDQKDGLILALPFKLNHEMINDEKFLDGLIYVYFSNEDVLTEKKFQDVSRFVTRLSDTLWNLITYIRMREQTRQLRILHSIAISLSQITENGNLLNQIAWNSLNILAADIITIYEYIEAEKRFLTPPSVAGRLRVEQQMRTELSEEEIPFRLLRSGSNKYASCTEEEPLFNSTKEDSFVKRENVKSTAGILLKVGQETVGTLFINYRHHHFFSDSDHQIIDILASSAAVAIKNQRWLDTLNEVDRDIISTFDQNKLLAKIVRKAVQITAADLGEIRLLDLGTQELVMKARFPENAEIDERWNRTSVRNGGEGITGWVANNRKSRIVYNVDEERLIYKPFFTDAKSELCVPLLNEDGGIIGVLNVESIRISGFDGRDQKRLEALADLVVVAIRNVQTNEQRMASERVATLNHIARSIFHRMNNHLGAASVWAKKIIEGSSNSQELAKKIRLEITQALDDRKRLRSWLDILRPVDVQQTIGLACSRVSIPTNIKVDLCIAENLPKILGNQEQLEDVFYNLIKNSVDAMPDGGNLSVNAMEVNYEEQGWIIIQVIDTGVGIKAEDQEKIYLHEYSTKIEHDGEGLWLTKTYIENSGGQITVESHPNEETKFTVLLPACR